MYLYMYVLPMRPFQEIEFYNCGDRAGTNNSEMHLLAGGVRLLPADGVVVAELVRVLGDVLLFGGKAGRYG